MAVQIFDWQFGLRTLVQTLVLASAVVFASGHYAPRVPGAGAISQMDDYELGKSIFLGKTPIKPVTGQKRQRQAERLEELHSKLPPSAKKDSNLPSLAGYLEPHQASALEHYLAVRYKVK